MPAPVEVNPDEIIADEQINFDDLKGNKGASNSVVVMLVVFIAILICLLFYFIKNPIVKYVEKEVAVTQTPANTTAVEAPKTYTYKDFQKKK